MSDICRCGITMKVACQNTCQKEPSPKKVSCKTVAFFVNMFDLYSDGSKQVKYLSNPRCVTGCYIRSFGLSFESKLSHSAARVIYLIPHDQNLNHILNIVVENDKQGEIQGFVATDACNRKVHVFSDTADVLAALPQRQQYVKLNYIQKTRSAHRVFHIK